ncbi:hypothetical protein [Desulfosporosinus sp. FKB]|uniref:hypothetical protein n=1 Tax=Desulfosporosinus sp. FKB TaxID=1969835 RepID=UPI000B49D7E9|nr:hypothetical protein [Desulfosporosinus sp. FKB]
MGEKYEALEIQISKHRNDIESIRTQLDNEAEIVIEEINEFIKEKYKNDIEFNVKTKVEVTKRLGIENLKELKADLAELIEKTPTLIEEYLNNTNCFTYKNYTIRNMQNEFDQKYNIKPNFNNKIESVIRQLYGHEGVLLFKYEYENYNSSSSWEKQYRSEIPRYKYGFGYSNGLKDSIDLYIKLFEQLHDTLVKLNKALKQKEEQEAIDLWEQA